MSTAHSSQSRPPATASLVLAASAGPARPFDAPARRSQRDLVIASLLRCPGDDASRLPF
jgi:hypothetical protein